MWKRDGWSPPNPQNNRKKSPLKKEEIVVGRILALKNAYVLNSRNCEYVTFNGKETLQR